MTDIRSQALQEALSRAEPTSIRRSYQSMSGGKDIGTVNTLLSPADVARRANGSLWLIGRPKYPVTGESVETGRALAPGIAAGTERYPDRCAACLAPPSRAVVFETTGKSLPGASGRYVVQVGMLRSIAGRLNPAYNRELIRPITAGNSERIWHPVPFCDAHDEKTRAIKFTTGDFHGPSVAFRNEEFGMEFGALNGIKASGFARRWWPLLALLLLFLTLFAVVGAAFALRFLAGSESSEGVVDLLVGIPILTASLAGSYWSISQLKNGVRARKSD
ncbi:MAG: hypothetical protein KJN71_09790 [Acidimicrobiia bacterium]|nr:hypothetical protein [Acidimicrobiia bacterium]